MSQLVPSTAPIRTFEDHEDTVQAVAVFPDRRRMVTCSDDDSHFVFGTWRQALC
ncbi:hypothetical protein CY34DRAFT_806480 [Suillus luteus UH-Slu-Lm8-n1]|uniref:Uncharacterized protein n=1 Tax=Suillus luteus UH-Slu-Lm8-n1 TaxID=930992 RepID=A0A0D0ASU6_9AGAM|nr:hypothetical protein CY34DRAFT_806480 [Suillus luteus UH-Slu-Lm8-n1]